VVICRLYYSVILSLLVTYQFEIVVIVGFGDVRCVKLSGLLGLFIWGVNELIVLRLVLV